MSKETEKDKKFEHLITHLEVKNHGDVNNFKV